MKTFEDLKKIAEEEVTEEYENEFISKIKKELYIVSESKIRIKDIKKHYNRRD